MVKQGRGYHIYQIPTGKTDTVTLKFWKKFLDDTPTPASITKLDAIFEVVFHQVTEFCGTTNVMDSKHNDIDDIAVCKRLVKDMKLESLTEMDSHMCVHFYNKRKSYYIHLNKKAFRKHMIDMCGVKF